MNSSPFQIVLVDPEIPPNTGNIARTCAATGTPLHLVGALGFQLSDKYLKRAGLDYWEHVDLHYHPDFASFRQQSQSRLVFTSARRGQPVWDFVFAPGDCLVFGSESQGLPADLLDSAENIVTIPIFGAVRSLNLANAVAVVLFEGLRQLRPRQ
jgi:tRNA (cytidine/uridine-2'-O-)-methyltransferase